LDNACTDNTLQNQGVKQLCEAIGCGEQATEQITVSAGNYGTLILFVCKNCIGKFSEELGQSEQENKDYCKG
jgi:hypothetical protein